MISKISTIIDHRSNLSVTTPAVMEQTSGLNALRQS